jgi:SAM-dependent methyltransferase
VIGKQIKSFDLWAEIYGAHVRNRTGLKWPAEPLIRMLCGDYIRGLDKAYTGKSVLDVGIGNGNNLLLYASLGLTISGIEVHSGIVELVKSSMREIGIESDLRVGHNRSIPYQDNTFDYLVSWNVLHYETDQSARQKALEEYGRVLKKGGRLFLSTVGPRNWILEAAEEFGDGRVRIARNDDFRKGEILTRFRTKREILAAFGKVFSDVQVGRVREDLFGAENDAWLVTGVRG